MNYKIVDFNDVTGQVTLQVDGFPLFAVDLPLDENNNVPVGEELDLYLKGFIPTWHLERQEKLSSGIANAEDIKALVQTLPAEQIAPQIQSADNTELKAAILTVLQEEGLIK